MAKIKYMFDFQIELIDRLEVIKNTIKKYGEENFYLSFSGGKDSTVLSKIIDMALPGNKIPRLYINTGIEYDHVRKFVLQLQKDDPRIVVKNSGLNVPNTLQKIGYPFKSKEHSRYLNTYQNGCKNGLTVQYYLREEGSFTCSKILRYQFSDEFKINISDKCCKYFKKKVFADWSQENRRPIAITGMRAEEGGHRVKLNCIITDKSGSIKKFHPLVKVDDPFMEAAIKKLNIELCDLYAAPYNFRRTGCKGCPFALDLQEQLTLMETYLPAERAQCERIWAPVYQEYRRIGYRLNKEEQLRLF